MNKDDALLDGQVETVAPAADPRSGQSVTEPQATAGLLLREARQSQGLDIAMLAAVLKVPVQKLQALERDQFDLLPDPAFARALASSMCRLLKLDPSPVLQRLPAITAFKVTSQNRGINTPFRARDGGLGPSMWSHMSRPAVLLGLSLLLGALVLILLPFIQQEIARYRNGAQGIAGKSKLFESGSITTPLVNHGVANSGAPQTPSVLPVEPLPPAEAQVLLPPAASVPAQLASASPAEASADATITFNAKGESWVKVTDAKGVVVLSRTLRAGESVGVSGLLPLAAVVGRADAIQVLVRDQAFGLSAVTRNNVARFEVK